MQSTTLSAGDPIEARCTKCRKNTNHIVVAMVEDVPAKVQCNTCSGQHKFRPPTAPKKPAVRRTVDPKIAEKKEWDRQKYVESRRIVVQGLGGPRKIKVLFEDGTKTMRCK